jgi:pyruvate/oxaloacetate carboxyltransferase
MNKEQKALKELKEKQKAQEKIINIVKVRKEKGLPPLVFGREPKKFVNGVWQ